MNVIGSEKAAKGLPNVLLKTIGRTGITRANEKIKHTKGQNLDHPRPERDMLHERKIRVLAALMAPFLYFFPYFYHNKRKVNIYMR